MRPGGLLRWCRRAAFAVLFAVLGAVAAERALERCWPYPLDRLRALEVSTVVEAADGTWLRVVPTNCGERVLPLRWNEAPALLRRAVLASEDERFFAHGGADWLAIGRATLGNLRAGRVVSGASTLTMQVVRIVEPRPRTLPNKFLELLRARQLERCAGKQQIASIWLQQVPMGGTLRGFAAAARYWFGRPIAELDAAELAALVAMVPAPSARSPLRHPARLRACRDALLGRLAGVGAIDAATAAAARARELGMAPHPWPWLAPQSVDVALEERGDPGAPRCRTALDLALEQRLRVVLDRADLPGDAAAAVVLDRSSGAVVAIAAGPRGPRDAARRSRCLGSTLKPFLYALASELGACAENALLEDAPFAVGGWTPRNFQRGHAGNLAAADALATSNNVAAVRCLQRAGVAAFDELLDRLGLPRAGTPGDLTAVLGTGVGSPLALARAYRRFVAVPESVGLSRASVDWTLRALQRLPLRRGERGGAMAWKSGTSSGRRDAWCVGIDAAHVVVVWLGNADGRGDADLVGARTAAGLLAQVAQIL